MAPGKGLKHGVLKEPKRTFATTGYHTLQYHNCESGILQTTQPSEARGPREILVMMIMYYCLLTLSQTSLDFYVSAVQVF